MPRVSLSFVATALIVHEPADAAGQIETRALFNRDCDPIHLHLHRLSAGASMTVVGDPTDCLIYVWEGAIDAAGKILDTRSSAIVEYRAELLVTASVEGAAILVFQLRERGKQDRTGGHVHVLPSERVPRIDSVQGKRVGMALHADSQCPTCNVWLHENDYLSADEETALHSHSEDEVIFVRAGNIRLGNRIHGLGTAVAIAAHTKYSFFSGPGGLSIVNFRGTSPTYRSADGTVVLDEAQLWHSHVGKPEYLELL
jgi:hypothetical protein